MNALKTKRRHDAEQADLAWRKKQEEEEIRVAKMSPEERKVYEADKAKRRMKTAQLLGLISSLSGSYSDPKLWR